MVDDEAQKDRPTVLVGCKVPNGLSLHIMKRVEHTPSFADLGGVTPGLEDKGFVNLAGPSFGKPATEVMTPVDEELWNIWFAENAESSLVTSGSIFKYEDHEDHFGDAPALPVEHMDEAELERATRPDPVHHEDHVEHE